MTGLNKLLKAMHGGQLPPKDSWLVLVRHEDGAFSAHIWLVSSPVRLGRMPGAVLLSVRRVVRPVAGVPARLHCPCLRTP